MRLFSIPLSRHNFVACESLRTRDLSNLDFRSHVFAWWLIGYPCDMAFSLLFLLLASVHLYLAWRRFGLGNETRNDINAYFTYYL